MIGAICGTVLGDTSLIIVRKGINAYLSLRHCKAQEQYLDYKMKVFSKLCKITKTTSNNGYEGYRIYSQCHPLLTKIRQWFYPQGKKVVTNKVLYSLTPLGLAFWYLDDGYLGYIKKEGKIRGREVKIYSQSFTKDENQMIVDYFQNQHGIKWRIGRSNVHGIERYHIATGAVEGAKFFKIIAPFVPEAMRYKLDMKYIYSSYAGVPNQGDMIQSELGSNVETATEMMAA